MWLRTQTTSNTPTSPTTQKSWSTNPLLSTSSALCLPLSPLSYSVLDGKQKQGPFSNTPIIPMRISVNSSGRLWIPTVLSSGRSLGVSARTSDIRQSWPATTSAKIISTCRMSHVTLLSMAIFALPPRWVLYYPWFDLTIPILWMCRPELLLNCQLWYGLSSSHLVFLTDGHSSDRGSSPGTVPKKTPSCSMVLRMIYDMTIWRSDSDDSGERHSD